MPAGSYMHTPSPRRPNERIGVSPLSTPRAKPFSSEGAGLPRDDAYMSSSGPVPGPVPTHGSPIGQPLAPSIGKGEPGFGGPGSEGRGDKRRHWW
jgi:hypothetical protein